MAGAKSVVGLGLNLFNGGFVFVVQNSTSSNERRQHVFVFPQQRLLNVSENVHQMGNSMSLCHYMFKSSKKCPSLVCLLATETISSQFRISRLCTVQYIQSHRQLSAVTNVKNKT